MMKNPTTGNWSVETVSLLNIAMKRAGMAIIRRTDGTYLNPNVSFLDDPELAQRLDVADITGMTFFVPSPVAEGSLLACTEGIGNQSTKVRVALPEGFHLLEGWLKTNGRADSLRRDKWGANDA